MGMCAVLVGMRMLVFMVMRMRVGMGMRRTIRMGMRMAVDSFVVVVVKVHGASSSFIFSRCIISVSLDFVKRARARLAVFPKNFFSHFPILSGISM